MMASLGKQKSLPKAMPEASRRHARPNLTLKPKTKML